eukprot:gb/GECH01010299.1/.p1 GENE.gb/GECH01010299.1/~~gb/GECH01010299.1/.p1  ORF type:complete len:633 (+),score=91.65 gb/GECH01010299.1/:1-1899(+)
MKDLLVAVAHGDLRGVRECLKSPLVNVNESLREMMKKKEAKIKAMEQAMEMEAKIEKIGMIVITRELEIMEIMEMDTPLHIACRYNYTDIVSELLQHPGINVNIKNGRDLPDDVTSDRVIKNMVQEYRNGKKRNSKEIHQCREDEKRGPNPFVSGKNVAKSKNTQQKNYNRQESAERQHMIKDYPIFKPKHNQSKNVQQENSNQRELEELRRQVQDKEEELNKFRCQLTNLMKRLTAMPCDRGLGMNLDNLAPLIDLCTHAPYNPGVLVPAFNLLVSLRNEHDSKMRNTLCSDESLKEQWQHMVASLEKNLPSELNEDLQNIRTLLEFDNDVDEFLYYEMAKIIGLDKVKENMNELVRTLEFNRLRKSEGLGNDDEIPDLNMVFRGNPGTGKTSIARIIPKLLHKMGMLPRGDVFVEAVRNDLVGEYVGHTASKTKKVIDQARGGVLFVDEAYQLMPPDSSRDFGREALETIMSEMMNASIDPDRRVVFIFAGYRKDMDRLLNANEGMLRRIQYFFEFEDYTPEQLADIMCKKVTSKKNYVLAPSLVKSLSDIIETEFSKEVRSKYNGGLVDKLLQFSKQKMKSRVVKIKKPNKEDLQTITKEDVLQAIRGNRFCSVLNRILGFLTNTALYY